ncbi:MAG: AraC family transcriptional regulator [Hyphomicrobiaceae bacterium]
MRNSTIQMASSMRAASTRLVHAVMVLTDQNVSGHNEETKIEIRPMQPGLYQIVEAPVELRPFVRRFMHANVVEPIDVTVRPAPTGFNYMGQQVGGYLTAVVDGNVQPMETPFHFSGQIQHQDISVRYQGSFQHILAEFAPTGLYRLLNVRGATVYATTVDVAEVDPALGERLDQALTAVEPDGDRMKAFAQFLTSLIPHERGPIDFVDAAVTQIEEAGGRVQVSELCAGLNVSERVLNRQFRDIVGIPPKYYSRVVQLNNMLGVLMSGNAADLTEIAHESGYYDQSHFIRTMQQFFQQSPREFLESEHDILE